RSRDGRATMLAPRPCLIRLVCTAVRGWTSLVRRGGARHWPEVAASSRGATGRKPEEKPNTKGSRTAQETVRTGDPAPIGTDLGVARVVVDVLLLGRSGPLATSGFASTHPWRYQVAVSQSFSRPGRTQPAHSMFTTFVVVQVFFGRSTWSRESRSVAGEWGDPWLTREPDTAQGSKTKLGRRQLCAPTCEDTPPGGRA